MKKTSFFIIGAPKSGTTAMADYLGEHENVFFCSPKEPCYFATDFPGQRLVQTADDYAALFNEAGDEHMAVGEGSVWYLLSEEALRNIYQYDSDARIIVMLRNPIEQVFSMHQELFHRRYEIEPDFTKAWNLQKTRRDGLEIPKYCKEPAFLQYGRIASYSSQVERLLQIFPPSQINITIFDDFKKDTRKTYVDLLNFLDLPDDGRTEFQPSLESRRHRLHWLGTFLINQPAWLIKARNQVKRMLRIERIGVRELVAKHNTVVEKRTPPSAEFVQELQNYFREDVQKLSELLDRDLNHWCK